MSGAYKMTGEIKLLSGSYEKLFRAFLQLVDDAILVVDSNLKIVDANQQASESFNIPPEQLIGEDSRNLVSVGDRDTLDDVFRSIAEEGDWKGPLSALRSGEGPFPVEINLRRMEIDGHTYFGIAIRNLSDVKAMEKRLSQEKAHRREMYITLRNVMNSIGKEKRGSERLLTHKIETLLLPILHKVKKEPAEEMRNYYLDIFQQELLNLTKGFPRELDIPFLRLTRMEMKICQYVQARYSSKEIADAFNVSFETVQTHRKNIRKKLGLRSRKISLYTFLSTRRNLGDISKL